MANAVETNPPNDDKVINRIRKMMAIANCNGASEEERDTALRMSYNLLAKHNLSMSQVEASGQVQEKREKQKAQFVVYPWARTIASQVGSLFFCHYYFQRPSGNSKTATHTFIGRESNAATAQYMAEYVVKSVLREAANKYGSATSPEGRCFAVGVTHELRERIAEIKKSQQTQEGMSTGTSLVLASLYQTEHKANLAYLEDEGIKLKHSASHTKGVSNTDAYMSGRDFGSKVSLSQQVSSNKSTTKAIS